MSTNRTDLIRASFRMFDEKLKHLVEYGGDKHGKKANPPCQKGCFSCCYEPVYAERREAELAVEAILAMPPKEQERIKADVRKAVEKLKAAPEVFNHSEPPVLQYRALRILCPLLKDGACSIYKDRPFGCRAHIALLPKEYCDDDSKRLKQQYMVMPDPISGLLAAIWSVDNGVLEMDHFVLWLHEILNGEAIRSGLYQKVADPRGGQELFR